MSPLKTPTCPDEHIEELLEQMMGPAIQLTDADTVSSPGHGDDTVMVRPLSRQSFDGHGSEPESSSNPIAPLKPPKTPLNSKRPISVSLSSAGDQRTPSSSDSESAKRKNQDDETAAAESSSQAADLSPVGDHSTSDQIKSASSSPLVGTSVAPYELYAIDYYYPFPSHDHGVSPDKDDELEHTYVSSAVSRSVTTCIDAPVTFATTWYSHFAAPEFFICSRCYADHIGSSQFRDSFPVSSPADGKPRVCRFSSPRMKDDLWKKAISSDYLQPVTDWMQLRSRIADCKGIAGAKGSEGTKWYAPKLNEFPSWFAVCQACYEDHIKVYPQLSTYFRPHPESQAPEAVWSCDLAVPFVQKEYEKQGPKGDWSTFVREAKARLDMPACPGQEGTVAYGKAWFRPVHGPDWLLLCAACFCDRVFHTADASKWAPDEQLSRAPEQQVRCPMAQFNISTAMSRAHDLKDSSVFWAAVTKLGQEKFCDPAGITDGVWYTLHGVEPGAGYQVCSSCYVSVAEPLGLSQFFRRKINIPPGATLPCCMNPAHPRASCFVPLLRETYYTQSAAALAAYADVYAAIPPCPRDGDAQGGRRWYGWKGCTICPECHHEFARKHAGLAGLMPLKNTLIEEDGTMCEMYSPLMRDLYLLCNGTEQAAPDLKPLIEFAEKRRRVFAETVLPIRRMLSRSRMGLDQQQQGAQYAQQAQAAGSGAVADVSQVDELEQRWRSVE
ncbi:hypothetical protein PG994_006516 [Apiospora phragmitis]|uniref:Integral membrane protein n=1 Tax=Apiospora phragmitis TaxID=2905665 RepID=A0ABR1VFB7_9PEZI